MGILGSDLEDWYMSLERRVARLERSASVANSQSDTTFVGTLAVSGLTVTSQTVVAYTTDFNVYVKFSWNAVTLDANIITDDPLAGYYTSFTKDGTNYTAETFTDGTTATIGPLPQGQFITFRVRAVTQKNTFGAYTSTNVTTTLDNTAPGQPSTPTVTPYLGQLRIFWDGLDVGAAAMPQDFRYCEIHLSTSSSTFTPTAATLFDTFLRGGGFTTITNLTYGTPYFCRLVAVDQVGNRSPVSTAGTGTPVQAADGDISALNVGKLVAGSLVADITVAARIKTANTGARVELNSSGLQAFNTAGTQTVNVAASTGDVTITGNLKTGIAGGGSAYITMDDSIDRSTIKFWEQTGTRFSYINSPTGPGGQVQLGLNTGNFDLVTGNLAGGTQGFARLYMNQVSTQLARVDAAQLAFGGEVLLTHNSASLRRSSSGGVNTGGQVFVDDAGVQMARNTAGSPTAGYGRMYMNSGGYVIEKAGGNGPQHRGDSIANVAWADSLGAMFSGVWIDSAGTKTFGPFNSDAGWSFADGANWANTSVSLNAWGPFVVMTLVTTRTGALGPGSGLASTVGTFTAAGSLTLVTTVVHFQNTTNHGVGNMTSGGVVQLNALNFVLNTGGSIRAQAVWWRG